MIYQALYADFPPFVQGTLMNTFITIFYNPQFVLYKTISFTYSNIVPLIQLSYCKPLTTIDEKLNSHTFVTPLFGCNSRWL